VSTASKINHSTVRDSFNNIGRCNYGMPLMSTDVPNISLFL